LTIREATPLLRVSYRQAKRLVQRFRAGGRKGLVHRCPRTTPASPCRPQVSSITIGRAIPAAWQTPMCSASRRRASWATITWCSIRIGRCSSSAARGGECRRRAKSSCAKCATARFASYTSPGMARARAALDAGRAARGSPRRACLVGAALPRTAYAGLLDPRAGSSVAPATRTLDGTSARTTGTAGRSHRSIDTRR
jgi:hypothetical protein